MATFIQAKGGAGNSANPSIAFVSPNSAGNFLVIVGRAGNLISSVTDTQGNVWKNGYELDVQSQRWYAQNSKAGANTVTAHGTTSSFYDLVIAEYSGLPTTGVTLDVMASVPVGRFVVVTAV